MSHFGRGQLVGPHAYCVGLRQHPYGLRPHMLRMLHIILLVSVIHFGKLNRPALPDDSSVIWENYRLAQQGHIIMRILI